jgi:hypothetical protein
MLILTATLYGEIELGMSFTPGSFLKSDEQKALDAISVADQGTLGDNILGFHVGYSFWWLFYASFDSLIVPPWWVDQQVGIPAPGYINFFDVGIRPRIGPIYLLATVGINTLYIHSAYADKNAENSMGVNIRLGAGLKFDALGISLTGTYTEADFAQLQKTITALTEGNDPRAQREFIQKLMPTIGFNLHL